VDGKSELPPQSSLPYIEVESSLGAVLNRLAGRDGLPLSIEYGDRVVQPGYHVTEVKASSFVTLDCGGNPDAWQETVLQVEDIPATDDRPMMTAGKFRSILAQVDKKVRLDHDARLTIEIGDPVRRCRYSTLPTCLFAKIARCCRWGFALRSANHVIAQSRQV